MQDTGLEPWVVAKVQKAARSARTLRACRVMNAEPEDVEQELYMSMLEALPKILAAKKPGSYANGVISRSISKMLFPFKFLKRRVDGLGERVEYDWLVEMAAKPEPDRLEEQDETDRVRRVVKGLPKRQREACQAYLKAESYSGAARLLHHSVQRVNQMVNSKTTVEAFEQAGLVTN